MNNEPHTTLIEIDQFIYKAGEYSIQNFKSLLFSSIQPKNLMKGWNRRQNHLSECSGHSRLENKALEEN